MMELRSDEEPLYTSYVHVLGNELQYIVLNSENVEEVVNKSAYSTLLSFLVHNKRYQ